MAFPVKVSELCFTSPLTDSDIAWAGSVKASKTSPQAAKIRKHILYENLINTCPVENFQDGPRGEPLGGSVVPVVMPVFLLVAVNSAAKASQSSAQQGPHTQAAAGQSAYA